MKGLSLRSYARHRRNRDLPGGSLSAVQEALRSGRIVLGPNGMINAAEADYLWEATTNILKRPPSLSDEGARVSEPISAVLALRQVLAQVHDVLFKIPALPPELAKELLTSWVEIPAALDAVESAMARYGVPLLSEHT